MIHMYRYLMLRYLMGLILLFTSLGTAQAAPLVIKITQGFEDATPIAVVPFGVEGERKPPQDIAAIVNADLTRTGKFKSLRPQDMVSQPHDAAAVKFTNWRILGVENIVVGKIKYLGSDRYTVSFWLFDVFKGKQMLAFNVPGTQTTLRATAHKISNIIYQELTGEQGAFLTKIAYVTVEGLGAQRRYSLWLADADAQRPQRLLKSPEPLMSPSWSPDGEKIVYASLEAGGKQRIFVQEWRSSRRQEIKTTKPGLYGAPAWSPDGKLLALQIAHNGNSEIYIYNLSEKRLKRLTRHLALDVEPAWTPDGKSIIFTSDRGRRPQLYKISANGGRAQRLTFEGNENARATVSPDGKTVAMVHSNGGKYHIAIMDLESGILQVLTDGADEMDRPSFAPNGSMIIYATMTGNKGELAAVSIDGRIRQTLSSQEDVREPAWSPFNNK